MLLVPAKLERNDNNDGVCLNMSGPGAQARKFHCNNGLRVIGEKERKNVFKLYALPSL